jgi:FeS assembly SUF system regulator
MLRVTKLADYGIVIMTNFATHADRAYNARDISSATRLPLPVVSKVLKSLARAGLLDSHRGTKGGYRLALPPSGITVAAIIRAIEGPIALTECTDQVHGGCDLEFRCPVKANWNLINQGIFEALEKITLAEMTQTMPQPLVNLKVPHRQLQAAHAPTMLNRKDL